MLELRGRKAKGAKSNGLVCAPTPDLPVLRLVEKLERTLHHSTLAGLGERRLFWLAALVASALLRPRIVGV
jgi:hypothetical protein